MAPNFNWSLEKGVDYPAYWGGLGSREVKAWPVGQVIHQLLMAGALCCHDEWPLSERETTQRPRQWHRQRHQFYTCQSCVHACVNVCVCWWKYNKGTGDDRIQFRYRLVNCSLWPHPLQTSVILQLWFDLLLLFSGSHHCLFHVQFMIKISQ